MTGETVTAVMFSIRGLSKSLITSAISVLVAAFAKKNTRVKYRTSTYSGTLSPHQPNSYGQDLPVLKFLIFSGLLPAGQPNKLNNKGSNMIQPMWNAQLSAYQQKLPGSTLSQFVQPWCVTSLLITLSVPLVTNAK